MLNSTRYPAVDYNLSFQSQQFSRAYGDAALFRSKFYNMSELILNPNYLRLPQKNMLMMLDDKDTAIRQDLKKIRDDLNTKIEFRSNGSDGMERFNNFLKPYLLYV